MKREKREEKIMQVAQWRQDALPVPRQCHAWCLEGALKPLDGSHAGDQTAPGRTFGSSPVWMDQINPYRA